MFDKHGSMCYFDNAWIEKGVLIDKFGVKYRVKMELESYPYYAFNRVHDEIRLLDDYFSPISYVREGQKYFSVC